MRNRSLGDGAKGSIRESPVIACYNVLGLQSGRALFLMHGDQDVSLFRLEGIAPSFDNQLVSDLEDRQPTGDCKA